MIIFLTTLLISDFLPTVQYNLSIPTLASFFICIILFTRPVKYVVSIVVCKKKIQTLNNCVHLYFLNFYNLIKSLSVFKNLIQYKWKPLFRKSSYFGLYRSHRNKWLNK